MKPITGRGTTPSRSDAGWLVMMAHPIPIGITWSLPDLRTPDYCLAFLCAVVLFVLKQRTCCCWGRSAVDDVNWQSPSPLSFVPLTSLIDSTLFPFACRSTTCSNLCVLPNGFTSKCEQKYVQKRLVALDGNGQTVNTDTFWFPSCCVCTIQNP